MRVSSSKTQKKVERYPSALDGSGYLQALSPQEPLQIVEAMNKYGFCVVGSVLSLNQCDITVVVMFQELNARVEAMTERGKTDDPDNTEERKKKKKKKKKEADISKENWKEEREEKKKGGTLDPRDPTTWEKQNWPARKKFVTGNPTFSQAAFDNRTCNNVYRVFVALYGGETRLWTSIDHWGLFRGTKGLVFPTGKRDRPEWGGNALGLHWHVDPWSYAPGPIVLPSPQASSFCCSSSSSS